MQTRRKSYRPTGLPSSIARSMVARPLPQIPGCSSSNCMHFWLAVGILDDGVDCQCVNRDFCNNADPTESGMGDAHLSPNAMGSMPPGDERASDD